MESSPPAIDYDASAPPVNWQPPLAWIAATLLPFATIALYLTTGLHNDNEFWPLWAMLAFGGLVAGVCYFRVRRSIASMIAGIVISASCLGGGYYSYRMFTGIDPHVLSRADFYCQNNMRLLGQVMLQYADEHRGRYPDSLEELITWDWKQGSIEPSTLLSHYGPDSKARHDTLENMLADIRAGGHCSFIYCGKGLTKDAPGAAILLYEPLRNHARNIQGIHVLMANGQTHHLTGAKAQRVIAALARGENPPKE